MTASGALRVLQVVEATTAGVGRHVLDLSAGLIDLGVDVTVACPVVREGAQDDVALVERLVARGVLVAPVPMRRAVHARADWQAGRALLALLRRAPFDVVHAHSSKAGVLGRLAARRAGVPAVVYTPHAFAFQGAAGRPAGRLYRSAERWLGHRATDRMICVGRSERELALRQRIVPERTLALVENGIDPAPFVAAARGGARPVASLDPSRPLIGFVGRLAPQKGLDVLIEALRLLVDGGVEASCVLVGEGEESARLAALVARRDLESRVQFAGYRDDIPQVLAELDVFVLPSRYEALPYSLLEAMAAGCAVVASDIGGNRDLLVDGETGLLVPAGDPHALAEVLGGLLAGPDAAARRAQLGRAAQAAAVARPTAAEMARETLALYRAVLAERRGAG
jgi:glycosyltransferase involved in cell wall biosynthesis